MGRTNRWENRVLGGLRVVWRARVIAMGIFEELIRVLITLALFFYFLSPFYGRIGRVVEFSWIDGWKKRIRYDTSVLTFEIRWKLSRSEYIEKCHVWNTLTNVTFKMIKFQNCPAKLISAENWHKYLCAQLVEGGGGKGTMFLKNLPLLRKRFCVFHAPERGRIRFRQHWQSFRKNSPVRRVFYTMSHLAMTKERKHFFSTLGTFTTLFLTLIYANITKRGESYSRRHHYPNL